MRTLISFAVRNVLRNKKRTLLTASSIFIAAVIVTYGIGFFNGFIDGFQRNEIDYFTGNLKVTTENYVKYERFMPVEYYIQDSTVLAADIAKKNGVSSVEERIRFGTILGTGENTEPALGIGVDLMKGKYDLRNKLVRGRMEEEGLYFCDSLARKLGIKVGDNILIAATTS